MKEGTNRVLRYGTGSPYLDVRLPCGGGINLHVDVNIDRSQLQRAIALGHARRRFYMTFDTAAPRASFRVHDETVETPSGHFARRFDPKLRIVLAGRGWEIVAMSQLAQTADVELVVASQELATLEFCRPYADQLIQLTVPRAVPDLPLDADTAVACLFHEHEWEGELLLKALRSPAFYVGALGSRQTQRARAETLTALGATADELGRLKGPIGLFPSQDPRSLAVSALAEIIKVRTSDNGGAE
jgi:xanthine dehydrogenase accessory factor